jgi:hypothetical protein
MCLSFQDKPALLIPWLVFTLVFLIENTVMNIYYAVQYFEMGQEAVGAGVIGGTIIYLRE